MIDPIFTAGVFIAGVIFFFAFYVIGYAGRYVFFGRPKNKASFIEVFVQCILFFSIITAVACWSVSLPFNSLMLMQIVVESMGVAFGIRDAITKRIAS
jgi:hypothetical protein